MASQGGRSWWWVPAVAVAIAVPCIVAGVTLYRNSAGDSTTSRPVPVKVVPCTTGTVWKAARLAGVLLPAQTVVVAPKTGGRIDRVRVTVGDHVEKGDLLAALETRDFAVQVRQAEAALATARANLARLEKGVSADELGELEAEVAQAEAAVSAARAQYEKMSVQCASGSLPREQCEQAAAQVKAGEAQLERARQKLAAAKAMVTPPEALEAARAQVRQAEAGLEMAQAALSAAELRAPIRGVVSEARGEPGEVVGAGTPLVVLVHTDPVFIDLNLAENLVDRLHPGDQVTVVVPVVGPDRLTGEVKWVSPTAGAQSRLFRARVEVPNGDGKLKPGMFAEVYIVEQEAEGIVVPQEALISTADGEKVFVVEGGVARERLVGLLVSDGTRVAVRGLSPGEQVVIVGQHLLSDGIPVSVVEGGA